MSLFCRHNRFTADCPICSKGTVLERGRGSSRRSSGSAGTSRERAGSPPAASFSGPHVAAGPYEGDDGSAYMVRLERVLGGLRLAEWSGSALRRRAPVLRAEDAVALFASCGEVAGGRDGELLASAVGADPEPGVLAEGPGVSRGHSGDFRDELRVEPLEGGHVRIGRWMLRPAGWQLQDAPPMLPAARYAEALAGAARGGLLASGAAGPARAG